MGASWVVSAIQMCSFMEPIGHVGFCQSWCLYAWNMDKLLSKNEWKMKQMHILQCSFLILHYARGRKYEIHTEMWNGDHDFCVHSACYSKVVNFPYVMHWSCPLYTHLTCKLYNASLMHPPKCRLPQCFQEITRLVLATIWLNHTKFSMARYIEFYLEFWAFLCSRR